MGRTSTNLIGKKFGLLTVVRKAGKDKWGHVQWQCICDCNGEKIAKSGDLGSRVKSCGCLNHKNGDQNKNWRGGKIEVQCANPSCGKTIEKHPSKLYGKSYCSFECRTQAKAWNNRPPQPIKALCAHCKKSIKILPCHDVLYKNHFCKGTGCFSNWKAGNVKGQANPNYHGGTPEMRKIRSRISAAMRKAIRQKKDGRTWESLVEYSMTDLVDRLKATIPQGYSWESDFINGKGVLHIDHIKPMSSFTFGTAEDKEFKRCFAIDNLQLLPAIENMKKSARLNL